MNFPLDGAAAGDPVNVDVELFLPDGTPMTSASGDPVCSPCTFKMVGPRSKLKLDVGGLLQAAGGPAQPVVVGFMVATITGNDVDNVGLLSTVVNAHSSQLDRSVFGFVPQEMTTRD